MNTFKTRREHDFPGDMGSSAAACWGVRSARAVAHVPISAQAVAQMPELVRARAVVKKAAARAHRPHPTAGRRADNARPGVPGLRDHDR